MGRGGRLLLRRPAQPDGAQRCRCASARWSACSRSRAVTTLGPTTLGARCPTSRPRMRLVPRATSRECAERRPHVDVAAARAAGGCSRSSDADRLRRVLARDARRGRVPLAARPPLALALPPRRTRSSSTLDGVETTRRLRAGRVDERPVRRQLELARAGLVPGQLPADRGAAASTTATSATTSRSSTRPARAAARRSARSPTSSRDRLVSTVPARRRRPPAGVRRHRLLPGRPGLARPDPRSTSTSTATPARASAPRTRPAGPGSSPT